jgi:transposase
MERRSFTREFKLEAKKLVKERVVAVAQASRDRGVHGNMLRKWIRDFERDPQQAFPGQGQLKPEQLEIERLRREVIATLEVLQRPFEFTRYTSEQFQRLMAANGVTCKHEPGRQCLGQRGHGEFLRHAQNERTAHKLYRTRDHARADVFDYIERCYNLKRRHSNARLP